MRRAARAAAGVLLALLIICAGAHAQYAGPQLSLVGAEPGALVLEGEPDGVATLAVTVRNDSPSGGAVSARLLLDDGTAVAAGGGAEGEPDDVRLAFASGSAPELAPRTVARLRLTVTAAAGRESLAGTLVLRLAGDDALSPLAIPVSASRPAAGAAALDFARARVEPASIVVSTSGCSPLGACPDREAEAVTVKGASVATEVGAGVALGSIAVAADDGDGRATVHLSTAAAVRAGASEVPLAVRVDDLDSRGTYAAEVPLGDAADAPTLSVKTIARDSVLALLIVLWAGAVAAYLWARYGDRGRPRAVAELALLELHGQHERDKRAFAKSARGREPHYTLADALPASTADWAPRRRQRAPGLWWRLRYGLREQLDLDARVDEVRALAGAVEQWLPACRAAAALIEARELLKDVEATVSSAALQRAVDALLECDTPRMRRKLPTGAGEAEALVGRLAAQRAFVARWLVAARLLLEGEALYELCIDGADDETADELRRHRPRRIAPELSAATAAEQLDASGVEDALREDLRLLRALAPDAALERRQAHLEAAKSVGREGAATLGIWSGAPSLTSPFQPGRDTPAEGARKIRSRLVAIDLLDFLFAAAVATLVVLPTLYDETFGTPWDYLAVFAAGAGAQLALAWQLLPWYRSTRLPKKAA